MAIRPFSLAVLRIAVICATVMTAVSPTAWGAGSALFTVTVTPGPECYDGQDNDDDGVVDYPDDDDCDSTSDTTEGVPPPPATSASSGPQPSGGTGLVIEPSTSVVFSGYAYPGSRVSLLRDAQVSAVTTAGADARFYIALTGLSPGNYLFLLYAESASGRRSVLHPFPLLVQKGAMTSIAGVVLNPTIALDKAAVRVGGTIGVYGDTAPGATLFATLLPGGKEAYRIRVGSDGVHTYQFSTQGLSQGEYTLTLAATVDGFQSGNGLGRTFTVGEVDVFPEPLAPCSQGDLNCDGQINLLDFSIAAYWFRRPLTGDIVTREQAVLNSDGVVDLRDLSIMAYYWTG